MKPTFDALLASLTHRRAPTARSIVRTERFSSQINALAERLGRPLREVQKEAETALNDMVAVQNPVFEAMFDHVLRPLLIRAWTVDVEAEFTAVKELKRLNESHSLVFLPTHRSYADPFILSLFLQRHGMKRNYLPGGNNMAFWPFGTILKRSGAVLIRRSFGDDEIYKLVVREYLAWLTAQNYNLEWYMEGGRSRTGKLRPPKYGLLRYLCDAVEAGTTRDILLVPVAITYDLLHEVGKMAAEEAGAAKVPEGLNWLFEYSRAQQDWIGDVHVRFGEPLSVREALARADSEKPGGKWNVAKIAFEVFQRINRVTPVTAPALATLALLGVRDRALTLQEVGELVRPLLDYAHLRGLPTSQLKALRSEVGVNDTLSTLAGRGVVTRYDAGMTPVFKIVAGQHSVAAYYRNSAIHWFVNRAILEVVLLDAKGEDIDGPLERAWAAAFAMRDLLKFEFLFSEKEAFRKEMTAETRALHPKFNHLAVTMDGRRGLLANSPFLIAHRVLMPFLEAYYIVADRIRAQPLTSRSSKKVLIEECVTVGQQYVLQQKLRNPECISREIFGNALSLAANRGLLEPGLADLAQRRQAFADELSDAVARVAAIEELERTRHAQNKKETDA
ncbi:MAG: 1-acyl-sn-glycerol-3-phosphate acyltransferase [Panacagrimonas sp.]